MLCFRKTLASSLANKHCSLCPRFVSCVFQQKRLNFQEPRYQNLCQTRIIEAYLAIRWKCFKYQSSTMCHLPSEDDAPHVPVLNTCAENATYFYDDPSEDGSRLFRGFNEVGQHLKNLVPVMEHIAKIAPNYDIDSSTPGNGFRSFLHITKRCLAGILRLSRIIKVERSSPWFRLRKRNYRKELESWVQIVVSLHTCLCHLETLVEWNEPDSLFPANNAHSPQELLQHTEGINQYCFYGRHLGFQFCKPMQNALQGISVAMAAYSDLYFSRGGVAMKAASALWGSVRYAADPEHKALRIVNVAQYATVDFCKAFWLLAEMEIMRRVPALVCPPLALNHLISIPPEPLCLAMEEDPSKSVEIPLPTAYGPPMPISARLISSVPRRGMVGIGSLLPLTEPTDQLVFHCHGGGFVAQSSKSHEVYLRMWAHSLKVPILSVDYSLAPAWPYPRALQEVLYVYAWAINNKHLLGWTGKTIVFAGDSAGANLLLGITLQLIQMGARLPNGLFLAYVPLLVQFVPSPSRLLCLTDPLLPFGFMMRCLQAYAGHSAVPDELLRLQAPDDIPSPLPDGERNVIENADTLDSLEPQNPSQEFFQFNVEKDPLLSPYLADDTLLKKLPPVSFLSCELDPCLDDSVQMCRRLKKIGKPYTLDILKDLPHGFLNFGLVSKDAQKGSERCVERLATLLGVSLD